LPAPERGVSVDRSTIHAYERGEPGPFYYARYDHPTGVEAEEALGRLDGGDALLFASGAAATAAAVLALCAPGKTIALADGCYYGTSLLFRELEPWGVRFVEFDQTGPPPAEADLVWLEAPSNPFLSFPDLKRRLRTRRRSWSMQPRRLRSCSARSSMAQMSSCTAPRSTSGAITTYCWAPLSSARQTRRRG